MDWTSLIGAGSSLLGGLFGGDDEKTQTQQTTLSPELKKFIGEIFQKIPGIFNRPYPEYEGQRVAGPTQPRRDMDQMVANMNSQMAQRASQGNPYQQRIDQMMNMSPVQISVPDLLGRGGASGVQMAGGYNDNPPNTMAGTPSTMSTPWLYGHAPQQQ